jgi:hypothetical protein
MSRDDHLLLLRDVTTPVPAGRHAGDTCHVMTTYCCCVMSPLLCQLLDTGDTCHVMTTYCCCVMSPLLCQLLDTGDTCHVMTTYCCCVMSPLLCQLLDTWKTQLALLWRAHIVFTGPLHSNALAIHVTIANLWGLIFKHQRIVLSFVGPVVIHVLVLHRSHHFRANIYIGILGINICFIMWPAGGNLRYVQCSHLVV